MTKRWGLCWRSLPAALLILASAGCPLSGVAASDEGTPFAIPMDFRWSSCDTCLYVAQYLNVICFVIPGSDSLDIEDILRESILLNGCFPLHWAAADVVSPAVVEYDECEYGTHRADGYPDLVLEFDCAEVANAFNSDLAGDDVAASIACMTWKGDLVAFSCCIAPENTMPPDPSSGLSDDLDAAVANSCRGNPNPFRATTEITYVLSKRAFVRLEIYDLLGRKVGTLVESVQDAGPHSITWGGTHQTGVPLGSGMYFFRLVAGAQVQAGKVILLR